MNRADLQQLAELRIREARSLLDAGCAAGAYYLVGYAIECALKARIAGRTQQSDFPDLDLAKRSYTHVLGDLIRVADLQKEFNAEKKSNKTFAKFWTVVKDWKESTRYDPTITTRMAEDLYTAITDPRDGVLQWLKKWW